MSKIKMLLLLGFILAAFLGASPSNHTAQAIDLNIDLTPDGDADIGVAPERNDLDRRREDLEESHRRFHEDQEHERFHRDLQRRDEDLHDRDF